MRRNNSAEADKTEDGTNDRLPIEHLGAVGRCPMPATPSLCKAHTCVRAFDLCFHFCVRTVWFVGCCVVHEPLRTDAKREAINACFMQSLENMHSKQTRLPSFRFCCCCCAFVRPAFDVDANVALDKRVRVRCPQPNGQTISTMDVDAEWTREMDTLGFCCTSSYMPLV